MTGYKVEGADLEMILLLLRVIKENEDFAVWALAWSEEPTVYRSKDGNKEVTHGETTADGHLIYQSVNSQDDL